MARRNAPDSLPDSHFHLGDARLPARHHARTRLAIRQWSHPATRTGSSRLGLGKTRQRGDDSLRKSDRAHRSEREQSLEGPSRTSRGLEEGTQTDRDLHFGRDTHARTRPRRRGVVRLGSIEHGVGRREVHVSRRRANPPTVEGGDPHSRVRSRHRVRYPSVSSRKLERRLEEFAQGEFLLRAGAGLRLVAARTPGHPDRYPAQLARRHADRDLDLLRRLRQSFRSCAPRAEDPAE